MTATNDSGTLLPGPGCARSFVASVRDDQCRRWERGDRVPVEDYVGQYPYLRADAEGMLDLVYNEIVLREQAGETPREDEYLGRFPHLAAQLRNQFEVHRALCSSQLLRGSTVHNRDHRPFPGSERTVSAAELLELLGQPAGDLARLDSPEPPQDLAASLVHRVRRRLDQLPGNDLRRVVLRG